MDCPRCNSADHCKAGMVQGRQRHKCKDCGYHYTVVQKSDVKSTEVRRMALEMYLEGLNYRIIGNLLQVSYGTVYQWIRKWGKQAELPRRNAPAKVVELDKLHHYIGTKKYSAGGHNLLLIDMGSDSSLMSAGVKTYTKK